MALALTAERGEPGYIPEGLLVAIQILVESPEDERPQTIALSSDVLGPTWFSDRTGAGLNLQTCLDSDLFKRNGWKTARSALDNIRSGVLDPSWRLSQIGRTVLGDPVNGQFTPVIQLLNAFESQMMAAFSAAAQSDAAPNPDKSVLFRDRLKRIVSVMCCSLVGIVRWRDTLVKSAKVPFLTVAPNPSLVQLISERLLRFCDGITMGELVAEVSGSGGGGFVPVFVGAFYEAVLGPEVMTHLSPILAEEYFFMLSRAAAFPAPEPSTEEHKRRARLTNTEKEAEAALPRAVSVEPFRDKRSGKWNTTAVDALHREVRRLMADDPDLSARQAVTVILFGEVYKRQLFFANFDGTDNATALYCTWQTMAMASGAITSVRAPGSSLAELNRRVLANMVLLDFHVLLLCPVCSAGIVAKIAESYGMIDMLCYGEADVLAQIREDAFGERVTTFRVGFQRLLRRRNSDTPAGHTIVEGKKRQTNTDHQTRLLAMSNEPADRRVFLERMTKSAKEATGYALLGVYALLAAGLYRDAESSADNEDVSTERVIRQVLGEEGGNVAMSVVASGKENAMLGLVAVWALRNAVRMRRDMRAEPGGDTGFPGAPLPLINAIGGSENKFEMAVHHPALAILEDPDQENLFFHRVFRHYGDTGHRVSKKSATTSLMTPFSGVDDILWTEEKLQSLTREQFAGLVALPLTPFDTY